MAESGVQSNGRACRLRAPFKARPACGDSHAIPSARPTADLISDGDTPSLPWVEAGGVAERAWVDPTRVLPGRKAVEDYRTPTRFATAGRRAAPPWTAPSIDRIERGTFPPATEPHPGALAARKGIRSSSESSEPAWAGSESACCLRSHSASIPAA